MLKLVAFIGFVALSQGDHHDSCLRTSDDIIATIYSAADQALSRGMCTSRDTSERFNRLERMISEISTSTTNEINRFVSAAESQLRNYQQTASDLQSALNALSANLNAIDKAFYTQPYYAYPKTVPSDKKFGRRLLPVVPVLDSRYHEINRYNNTINSLRGKRVFRYYWKIPNINKVLWGSAHGFSLRSPSFDIFDYGYSMYMRIHPRQPSANTVSMSVGIAPGKDDPLLDWPFKLKHYISVLDHSNLRLDMSSKLIDPNMACSYASWVQPYAGRDNRGCTAMTFSSSKLMSGTYIEDNTLLLRLTVHLD